jgi:hypothetical protein
MAKAVKVLLMLALLAIWPAHAAIVPVATTFGPDTGTLDTDTDLIFLDVGLTAGLSYNQIHGSEFGSGGMFAGFRYATADEVVALFEHSGLLTVGPITPAAEAQVFDFTSSLGISPVDVAMGTGDRLAYRALTGDPGDFPLSRRVAELVMDRVTIEPSSSEIFFSTMAAVADDVAPDVGTFPPEPSVRAAGSWLVITSTAIPVPATLWLLMLGAGALALSRRRSPRVLAENC